MHTHIHTYIQLSIDRNRSSRVNTTHWLQRLLKHGLSALPDPKNDYKLMAPAIEPEDEEPVDIDVRDEDAEDTLRRKAGTSTRVP